MCDQGVCLEKCQLCNKLDLSCCNHPPIWKEEELAELNFKTSILAKLEKEIRVSYLREYNGYVITKREDAKGDKVKLYNPCIFFDKEKGLCTIYEYRPGQCRSKGTLQDPCKFTFTSLEEMKNIKLEDKDILSVKMRDLLEIPQVDADTIKFKLPKIRKFSKKDLKNIKEDALLYLVLNSLNNLRDYLPDNGYIKFNYHYGLVLVEQGNRIALNSVRYTKASTDIIELKPLARVYNLLNRKFVLRDYIYIETLVDKIRRIMKGVTYVSTGLDENNILSYLGSAIPLLDLHKTRFKNKKYKDLIKDDELYMIKKYMFKLAGSDSLLQVPELVEKLYTNADRVYKAIIKQR